MTFNVVLVNNDSFDVNLSTGGGFNTSFVTNVFNLSFTVNAAFDVSFFTDIVQVNDITTSTKTNLTGIIKGNGTTILVAAPGTDYQVPITSGPVVTSGNVSSYTSTTGTGATVLANAPALINPSANTQAPLDNSTKLATTAYVDQSTPVIQDASATVKGILKLAGDLGGTAALPTVPALATKAPLLSPALTGIPTAPTASPLTDDTQIATTAYVDAAVSAAPGGVTSVTAADSTITVSPNTGAVLVSRPAITGDVSIPTGGNSATLATVATPGTSTKVTYDLKGRITSGTTLSSSDIPNNAANTSGSASSITGDLTGPITSIGMATSIASQTGTGTKFVVDTSPALTGTPTTPTAAPLTDNTQIASTAYVDAAVLLVSGAAIDSLTTDVVASGPGAAVATIQPNVVTNAKLAQAPTLTIKGNNTGGTANELDLTIAQVNTMLGDVLANGTVPFSANQSFGGNNATALADPTTAQQAATKNYVDTMLAALNPYESVYAATVGSNIAGTYVSVAAGIGDTFTTTSTATFTLDGTTPPIHSRILFKDQTDGTQNGIYSFTTLPVNGVSGSVFTRSSDYNTPSDMNGAGLIPVINGTLNAVSSWQQTATIVSIGPAGTALVFQEFTANPSLYLLKANNLSDVSNANTSFNNISPMTTLGDIIYGGVSGAGTKLSGNTTTTRKFIRQTGDGVNSAAPAWDTLISGDIPNNAANTSGSSGSFTGNLSGDITGTQGATVVSKIDGTTVSGTTGTVNSVFSNSPTLVSPALGTPTALVGTNITGTAPGLTAGNVTGPVPNSALQNSSISIVPGTSGTDVNFATNPLALGDTGTFNIPVASSLNTGKLANTDWQKLNTVYSVYLFYNY